MNINIEDYLSHEEIKRIATEELKATIKKDSERVLGNLAHYFAAPFVEALITEKDLEALKEKVVKLLSEESSISFHIFSKHRERGTNTKGVVDAVIQKAIEDNIDIVRQKTIRSLNSIDVERMAEYFTENMSELVVTLLKLTSGGSK